MGASLTSFCYSDEDLNSSLPQRAYLSTPSQALTVARVGVGTNGERVLLSSRKLDVTTRRRRKRLQFADQDFAEDAKENETSSVSIPVKSPIPSSSIFGTFKQSDVIAKPLPFRPDTGEDVGEEENSFKRTNKLKRTISLKKKLSKLNVKKGEDPKPSRREVRAMAENMEVSRSWNLTYVDVEASGSFGSDNPFLHGAQPKPVSMRQL